jgi:NAD(P)-dependent dehydrogenase (short-subunit alcohol dehydrogenase family)
MDKKVVLVTGASSGLGKSIAEYLSKDYQVYGTSRKANQGEVISQVTFLQLDVSDKTTIQDAISYVLEKEGHIDFLINNAGVGIAGSIEETPEEMIREVFETNFFGVLNVCKGVLPVMRKQQSGCIINVSSIGGEIPLPYRGYYTATKSAVEHISEAMRMEVKPFGIRVAVLQPGDFTSNINHARKEAPLVSDSDYYPYYKKVKSQINTDVDGGFNPVLAAKVVKKIMEEKHPGLKYKVGAFMQRNAFRIKNLLPYKVFEKMLMKEYGL